MSQAAGLLLENGEADPEGELQLGKTVARKGLLFCLERILSVAGPRAVSFDLVRLWGSIGNTGASCDILLRCV